MFEKNENKERVENLTTPTSPPVNTCYVEISHWYEDARRELGELGIQYDKESFLKAIENEDLLAIGLFIGAGMDPNTKNNTGETVLVWAVKNDKIEIVRILLDKGADPNRVFLLWAIDDLDVEAIQTLLDNGADVNTKFDKGFTFLMEVIRETAKEIQAWHLTLSRFKRKKSDISGTHFA